MLRKNENLHSGFNQICDGEKDQMFMNIQLLIGRQGESWPSPPSVRTASATTRPVCMSAGTRR